MQIPTRSGHSQVMQTTYMCAEIRSTDVGNGIGLIAPRVAVCAAHEANKVLQLIMQIECIVLTEKGEETWKINLY